jgi:succinate dehydrogenase / fumarate reductase cytochrome b subunit
MTTAAPAASIPSRSIFVRHRLGSLVAVVPLGVWTILHLWDNLAAFESPQAWERTVTHHAHPVAHAVTAVIVFLPLLLHIVWGLARLRSSRPNNTSYRGYDNLKYLLQRVSALGVLLFLGAHVWLAYLRPRLLLGHGEHFEDIAREMRFHMPTLVVYILGTLGVAYHLDNGLATFAIGWGLTTSRSAARRWDMASIVVFFVLLAMSWLAIYALWLGGAASPPR